MRDLLCIVIGVAMATASAAKADPCEAIPDKGLMPPSLSPGARFAGPVVYVGDGDGLCVAVGQGAQNWVEVRLSDFYAPELREPGGRLAKSALERIASGKRAVCVADHRSHDRVVARCLIDGFSIGDRMRAAGVREGGNGR